MHSLEVLRESTLSFPTRNQFYYLHFSVLFRVHSFSMTDLFQMLEYAAGETKVSRCPALLLASWKLSSGQQSGALTCQKAVWLSGFWLDASSWVY